MTGTSLTIRLTMSSSSGLASATIMGYFLRLLQLLSTCLAFSLVAATDTWRETIGNWSMFIWCFCFVVTLLTFIVELCGLQFLWPFSWDDFLINYASYSTLLCLSASIIYPTTYIQIVPRGNSRNHAIAATAFSCLASVTYATEVAWIYAWPSQITCYVLPMPGLLKGLENFVACVIFAFISNTSLYLHQPALVWCVAVYSICLFLGAVALLLYLRGYSNKLPICFPIFLLGLALLSVFLYVSALVLWLLYQFDENFGGQPQRSSDMSCRHQFTHLVCIWDQRLVVAILTAVNLLIYMADLGYWARWVFVRD
ncbi:myeloid-associated differentiation marker-like [Cervus canadensis]|uniref:myeloid-associated differentiation marker-like n=1 Tax=Cervus canadensis TaxID=1574408 RepID=UPI001C9E30F7|nr:myeloid-associated differentiation marker-like [Cervus canadensis]